MVIRGVVAILLVVGAASAEVFAAEKSTADWPTWGGSPSRNMVNPQAAGLATTWDCNAGTNIKWSAQLGRTSYGNPTLANGRIVVGTNNENPRDPHIQGDCGVLMCFNAADGGFLWQDAYEKLPDGRSQDWPLQGLCSSPAIDADRVYYLNNRAQLVCADLHGFHDDENDGPFQGEERASSHSADIVWRRDFMAELGVRPRFMASSNPLVVEDRVFVLTSNGAPPEAETIAHDRAASIVAVDKTTGELLWQQGFQRSGGQHQVRMQPILEGQWASAAYGTVTLADGRTQAQLYFPGGDGYLYALDPEDGALVWKCDCNPPGSQWSGGRGDKNYLVATPVAVGNRVYIATGQDPEHGSGPGSLLAIDASGRGDITATHVRWRRGGKEFGRSISTIAVWEGIVYAAELDGFLHALDAATGEELWQHDMLAAVWGSPLVADGKVYLADEDGDVAVFAVGREKKLLAENHMTDAIYGTPIAAGGVLYMMTRGELVAIEAPQPPTAE
jgi:outer membrane protein assembly factor BamB